MTTRKKERIKRACDYKKFLIDNESFYDWDYTSVLYIMSFQLKRLASEIKRHQHSLYWERDYRRILQTVGLIDKLVTEDYSRYVDNFLERHPDYLDDIFIKRKSSKPGIAEVWSPNPDAEDLNKRYKYNRDRDNAERESDWNLLWKILNKHMRSWWD